VLDATRVPWFFENVTALSARCRTSEDDPSVEASSTIINS